MEVGGMRISGFVAGIIVLIPRCSNDSRGSGKHGSGFAVYFSRWCQPQLRVSSRVHGSGAGCFHNGRKQKIAHKNVRHSKTNCARNPLFFFSCMLIEEDAEVAGETIQISDEVKMLQFSHCCSRQLIAGHSF